MQTRKTRKDTDILTTRIHFIAQKTVYNGGNNKHFLQRWKVKKEATAVVIELPAAARRFLHR
jgi:hypothetical protein